MQFKLFSNDYFPNVASSSVYSSPGEDLNINSIKVYIILNCLLQDRTNIIVTISLSLNITKTLAAWLLSGIIFFFST